MAFVSLALMILLLASCGGEGNIPTASETVVVSPTDIACAAEGGLFTLGVSASDSFRVFPADGTEWISVEPSYSEEPSASISVKIKPNYSHITRTSFITVKCGETRERVMVEQEGITGDETLDIDVPAGYHLDWREEFDMDGAPSTAEWWYETGGGGWGNNELQTYVAQSKDGVDLAYVSNGTLKIQTRKVGNTICSIRMNTKRSWTYGWFEASLKVSDVRGSWPAFWMMPQNFKTWPGDGEVDIMEYAISTQGKNYSSSSIHCNAFNHMKGTQKTHKQYVDKAATEFHVYACEWTADWMKFYIDGKLHLTVTNDGQGYDHWPFYTPFYLKLNQAWGGNMGGTTDQDSLPAIYEIDYIRVFQKD